MEVWVLESDQDDYRLVDGVYSAPLKAFEALKETYGPPYIVRWEPAVQRDESHITIGAVFSYVPDYSVPHRAEWELTKFIVDGK